MLQSSVVCKWNLHGSHQCVQEAEHLATTSGHKVTVTHHVFDDVDKDLDVPRVCL